MAEVEKTVKRLEKMAEALLEIAEALPGLVGTKSSKSKSKAKPAPEPEPDEDEELEEEEVEEEVEEEEEAEEEESPSDDGDLDSMNRIQLLPLAKELGIDSRGKKGDELRELIREAQGDGGTRKKTTKKKGTTKKAAASKGASKKSRPAKSGLSSKKPAKGGLGGAKKKGTGKPKLSVRLETFISNNYADFAEILDGERDEETGVLGCQGVCTKCPNPEEYDTAAEQVKACYATVKDRIEAEEDE